MSKPASTAISVDRAKSATSASIPARSSSAGTGLCSKKPIGEADTMGQPPSSRGSLGPSQSSRVDPLRPAWPS